MYTVESAREVEDWSCWKWPLNVVYVRYLSGNKQAARAVGRGGFAKASYTQASTRSSFHFSIYIKQTRAHVDQWYGSTRLDNAMNTLSRATALQ